jgi:hypothetical protein
MIRSMKRNYRERSDSDRECIWSKTGDISHRLCLRGFQCAKCELDQTMIDLGLNPDGDGGRVLAAA